MPYSQHVSQCMFRPSSGDTLFCVLIFFHKSIDFHEYTEQTNYFFFLLWCLLACLVEMDIQQSASFSSSILSHFKLGNNRYNYLLMDIYFCFKCYFVSRLLAAKWCFIEWALMYHIQHCPIPNYANNVLWTTFPFVKHPYRNAIPWMISF